MSRIGKKPINIPAGVTVTVEGCNVTTKGPKGTLARTIDSVIGCAVENNQVILTCNSASKDAQAKHGLYRALVNNMVVGVAEGFKRTLIINGVGYKSSVSGNKLVLNIGYSHPVEVEAPANIKAKRPVEPYHAYGIRYKEEVVVLKEGKKSGK